MRITFRSIDEGLAAINAAAEQFVQSQGQVETGKRVRAASDDPAAAQRIVAGRTEMGVIDAYKQASDTATSRLTVIDTVLGGIVDKLTEAKATATAARGSTVDQASRDALAAKLAGIRDALAEDLNATFRGTYLFSGSQAQAATYAKVAGAWTYQGDTAPVTVEVGRGRRVTVALDGSAIAQGGDANDVLTEFDALVTAVSTGDAAGMATGTDALGRAFDRAVRAQSLVGVDESSIDDERARLTSFRLASQARVSKDEDANLAEAITRMTQAQTAYQAALGAVGAQGKVSLLDYLR